MKIISEIETKAFLQHHPQWHRVGDLLVGKYEHTNFTAVTAFVNKCIQVMNEIDNHPSVTFAYNFVEITTCTHDAGNVVTDRDLEFVFELNKTISV
jgi:4a-hydroxytetrahydrobiopterin dehydratase